MFGFGKKKSKPERQAVKQSAAEIEALQRQWEKLADDERYILAVYDRGKSRNVDVLSVNGAFTTGKTVKKLKLELAAPKCLDDGWLLFEKEFELPLEKLICHEVLKGKFEGYYSKPYMAAVKRGLKIAKKL